MTEKMVTPDIEFPTPSISLRECDQCLGAFMRSWDQLEIALFTLFHKLIDTDITTATTLFYSGADLRRVREIIRQLGKNRLQPQEQTVLNSLLRRVERSATKRNRIIHGHWTLFLTMGRPPRPKPLMAKSAKWIRQYRPTDKDHFETLMRGKSQKLAAAYNFSPKQLINAAAHVTKIAKDIESFTEPLVLLPAPDPRPVKW